jgi:hypothetical protein
LLLKDDAGKTWSVPVQAMYRSDIADNLTDQKNDMLTGFFTVFEEDTLPEGEYLVGMLAKDRTSRQRLVNWSDVKLRIHRKNDITDGEKTDAE